MSSDTFHIARMAVLFVKSTAVLFCPRLHDYFRAQKQHVQSLGSRIHGSMASTSAKHTATEVERLSLFFFIPEFVWAGSRRYPHPKRVTYRYLQGIADPSHQCLDFHIPCALCPWTFPACAAGGPQDACCSSHGQSERLLSSTKRVNDKIIRERFLARARKREY